MPIKGIIVGIIISILTSLIIFKGIKEISDVISKLIPFVAILYIITCLIIIIKNINIIDDIIRLIIRNAFNIKSFIVGSTKSIFSTEAGLGTGAIACSITSNAQEDEQGLVQVFGIFFDTFVVSTFTAFIILLLPKLNTNLLNINGIELTRCAFIYNLGKYGGLILTVSIILFAFSTIISGYYYGEVAIKYITKKENTLFLKILTIMIILISTVISPNIIWNSIDKFIVILAIINTLSLIMLRKKVFNDKI